MGRRLTLREIYEIQPKTRDELKQKIRLMYTETVRQESRENHLTLDYFNEVGDVE